MAKADASKTSDADKKAAAAEGETYDETIIANLAIHTTTDKTFVCFN